MELQTLDSKQRVLTAIPVFAREKNSLHRLIKRARKRRRVGGGDGLFTHRRRAAVCQERRIVGEDFAMDFQPHWVYFRSLHVVMDELHLLA